MAGGQENLEVQPCGPLRAGLFVTGLKQGEKLVDLVGIEPTTSSMPWKRAPSCATGPFWRTLLYICGTSIIFADVRRIVNATFLL